MSGVTGWRPPGGANTTVCRVKHTSALGSKTFWILVGVGILSGFFSGIFGIGGGTIIVPALVWLGLSQRHAAATSLAAIVPTSISGVIAYATGDDVDWMTALFLAVGMVIGSQIGSWLLARLSELFLRWSFVVFLIFVIVSQLIFTPSRNQTIRLTVFSAAMITVLGVFMGVLAALLGIGGGAVAVPALSILFGASDLIARGTSLLAMIPGVITGTVANWRRRLVHLRDGLVIGLAAMAVAPLGTLVAGAVSPRVGANLFALYLGVLLLRSAYTALQVTPGAAGLLRMRKRSKGPMSR